MVLIFGLAMTAMVGAALASTPEVGGGTGGATLNIDPSDSLPASMLVVAIGGGFGQAAMPIENVVLFQCTAGGPANCLSLGAALTGSVGEFWTQPVVTSSFVASGGGTINCLAVSCFVRAVGETSGKSAEHHLTFAGATSSTTTSTTSSTTTTSTTSTTTPTSTSTSTTTSTTVTTMPATTSTTSTTIPTTTPTTLRDCSPIERAKATFNTQLDLAIATILANMPPGPSRDAMVAARERQRASGNAAYDAQLAACRAASSTTTTTGAA